MKYTVDYFIKKFKSIPEKSWTVGADGWTGRGGKYCAGGHCGYSGIGTMNDEFAALTNLLRPMLNMGNKIIGDWQVIYYFNDGIVKRYKQKTPKKRMLAVLRDIKNSQQPAYENITGKLAVLPVDETSDIKKMHSEPNVQECDATDAK